jgi:hypothetical protein
MSIGLTIMQNGDGSILTATDSSSGITVTSRQLQVYDANNLLLNTYNMGVSLTQDVPITSDVVYTFILTLNGSLTKAVIFMSTRYYDLQALKLEQALDCSCRTSKSLCSDAVKALIAKANAATYFIFGQVVNSQRNITAANTLISQNTNCGC